MAQVANEPIAPRAGAPATAHADKSNLWALALGSVGVVYGDIGTSPLYAFRVAVVAAVESGAVTRDIVLGVLSLILLALDHRHPSPLVCGAEPRDRAGGELLRAGHGDLVRRHCGSRTSAYSR